MSRINPYQSSATFYTPAVQSPTRTPGTEGASAASFDAAPVQQTAPAAPEGITPAEQSMIAQEFPAEASVSLRLYGPGRGAETLTPRGLGQNLDLRG